MDERRHTDSGQVGIGTLIVFIAMVLVAAIAAGVLINTAGFLQSKSEQTGEQSSEGVTNRLNIAPKSGQVGAIGGEEVVGVVNVTVQANPGASNIDLRNVTVQWVGAGGADRVTHYAVDAGDADFSVSALKDNDGSVPVLNDADDRFILTFDTGAAPHDVVVDTESGSHDLANTESPVGEGESVSIRLTSKSGATTTTTVSVPETLSGESSVQL
jgi:flagellin-like protein